MSVPLSSVVISVEATEWHLSPGQLLGLEHGDESQQHEEEVEGEGIILALGLETTETLEECLVKSGNFRKVSAQKSVLKPKTPESNPRVTKTHPKIYDSHTKMPGSSRKPPTTGAVDPSARQVPQLLEGVPQLPENAGNYPKVISTLLLAEPPLHRGILLSSKN